MAFIYSKKKVNQTHRVFKYLHVNVISLATFASTKYLCNFTGTVAQCQRQVGYERLFVLFRFITMWQNPGDP